MSNPLCTPSESVRTAAFLLCAPSLTVTVLAVGKGLPHPFLFVNSWREGKVNTCKSFHVKR